MKRAENDRKPINRFYRIVQSDNGLVDVWLTPGEVMPIYDTLTGRMDYGIKLLAVVGVDPEDPQWGGDLEGHIRAHYLRRGAFHTGKRPDGDRRGHRSG